MSTNTSRPVAAIALALALVLAACGDADGPSGELVEDGLGCQPNRVERQSDPPEVTPVTDAPEGVGTEDLEVGDGCEVAPERFLALDLVGVTEEGGEPFIDTFADDGRPVVGQLGVGTLLPGLEEGLAGMRVGGRRQITVPAPLAYGEEGNPGQGIGPDEDLVFVADLVSVLPRQEQCNEALPLPEGTQDGKPADVEMPLEVPTELDVTELQPGEGPEATAASYVTVNYVGVGCSSGQQFDSSWDRDEPLTLAMAEAEPTPAAGTVIPGWTEGLEGATEGSLVQLDIPPALAYGPAGQGTIGPNESLVFVIEVLEVSDEPPPDPAPEGDGPAEPTPDGGEAPAEDAEAPPADEDVEP
ncbi:FKBP-type peptidyl-prolyl cis-trans isomerase [soil metagenome]